MSTTHPQESTGRQVPSSVMLHLTLPTDHAWEARAMDNLDEVLIDHAWCEQKAASTAISLIVRHPDLPDLVDTMTDLAQEEWGHFRRVLAVLKERGVPLGRPRQDEYARRLAALERKGTQDSLLDKLLICAIIEARSCERFRSLARILPAGDLRDFYLELMASEAGHYTVFTDLARKYFPNEGVRARLANLMRAEGEIVMSLDTSVTRVH